MQDVFVALKTGLKSMAIGQYYVNSLSCWGGIDYARKFIIDFI